MAIEVTPSLSVYHQGIGLKRENLTLGKILRIVTIS